MESNNKETQQSKRNGRLTVFVAGIAVVVILEAVLILVMPERHQANDELFTAVRNHVETHGQSFVTLGELTDFEWCLAAYFRVPSASPADIEAIIGVPFNRPMDLVGGMVFVRDGEIVYFEIFIDTFLDTSDPRRRFIVQPPTTRAIKLEHNDLFEIGRSESGLYWMTLREQS